MKIAYFDCFAGASGDMMLGSLVDLGLDLDSLTKMLEELGISGFSLSAEKALKKGITVTDLKVNTKHEHVHRHLKDIHEIVDSAVLSDSVKKTVGDVFAKIAVAEGKIHGKPPDKVHFHEVGALDSIIDIVGTVWGIEQLGIEKCYSSPISLGSGTVNCAHGVFPVPAPATVEIVQGFPVIKKEVGAELCTPTGAALITTLAEPVKMLPEMKITAAGYACGDREFEDFPNVFRILIGETDVSEETDSVMLIETNIDDMNPEIAPYVIDRLLETGALDAFLIPVLMKKGRPGYILTAITPREKMDACISVILNETSTLGVRISENIRKKLPRESGVVQTEWGEIKVKRVFRNGKWSIVPEFEECRTISESKSIPLTDVYDAVRKAHD